MVLLFLIALLLAWPTAGISIIVYVAYAILRSYWIAKIRIDDVNRNVAKREMLAENKRVPSWAGDQIEREVFVETIQTMAMREGVPLAYLQVVLGRGNTFQNLVYYAGEMEYRGASFIEQMAAVKDEIIDLWKSNPHKVS